MQTRRRFIETACATAAYAGLHEMDIAMAQTIEPVATSEKMMYSTARLFGSPTAGQLRTGTGFFFNFPHQDRQGRILVTNKHVVNGLAEMNFVVHAFQQSDKPPAKPTHRIAIKVVATDWIPHPDPKIDLCAIPFGDPPNPDNLIPFTIGLAADLIPSAAQLEDLGAVEDILMIGYPNGLWDAANNYPLVRRGITSSHPAVDFDVDGVATTVVDVAAFPGSSGSPIFIYNSGTIPDKKGNITIGSRLYFLGVLFAGPLIQSDGKIIIRNVPTVAEPIAQVNLMMNLGYAIKSKELPVLVEAVRKKLT